MTTPPRSRRDNLRAYAILAMLVLAVIAAAASIRASRDAKMSSQENRRLLKERAINDQERTSLIKESIAQGARIEELMAANKAQGDRIGALSKGQTVILEQVKVIARQVPDCFTPQGACTVAQKAQAANLQAQLTRLQAQVENIFSRTTFVVTNPARPGDTPLTVTPIVKPCEPQIRVGETGIGQGVICRAG